MVLMKTKFYLLMSLLCVALVSVGCSKEKKQNAPEVDNAVKVVGEWHCSPEGMDVDVYVAFAADGNFDEYQRLGEGRYRHYAGTWSVEKDVISGVYADGTAWGCTYTLAFEGDTMTLTANNDSMEALTYIKVEIPAEVKDEAIDPLGSETRAEEERWF
jgi:hypothetical protein